MSDGGPPLSPRRANAASVAIGTLLAAVAPPIAATDGGTAATDRTALQQVRVELEHLVEQSSSAREVARIPGIWCCCATPPADGHTAGDHCVALFRTAVGAVMCALVAASVAFLAAAFVGTIVEASVTTGILLTVAYIACSVATFYLEGGHAARMLAQGLPMSALEASPIGRRFVASDARDNASLTQYMGLRQFLVLSVTTVAGAVLLPQFRIPAAIDSAFTAEVAASLLLVSHLIVTATLCQVLPQIRADAHRTFLGSWGALAVYYACAVLGLLLNPSFPALVLHRAMDTVAHACGCGATEADPEPGAVDTDAGDTNAPITNTIEPFDTQGVSKFPVVRWPNPAALGLTLAQGGLGPVRSLLPPTNVQHLPPHLVVAVLKVLAEHTRDEDDAVLAAALRRIMQVA